MVQLDLLPCVSCKHFDGVKSVGPVEKENQYVGCKKAEQNNAANLLSISDTEVSCEKYEEE